MSTGLLRSPDEELRRAGVAALRSGPEELRLLVVALGDSSWRVRKEAVGRAASWEDRDAAAAALVEALAEPDNVGRRNAVIESLARIGGAAVAPLLAALEARPDHRKLIADTLGLIGDRRGAAPLVTLLGDDDENVRAAAAEALGHVGGPLAEVALVEALEGRGLLVSLACLGALLSLGVALPVARLLPLLETTVQRPAVLAALGASRDAAASLILVHHLCHRARGVREAATLALERLAGSLGEAERAAAARALRGLGDDAVRPLIEALLEGAPPTRRAAATVLGVCGNPASVRPLILALGDPEVEEAAARALAQLGGDAIAPIAAMLGEAEGVQRLALFRLIPSLRHTSDPQLQASLRAALDDEDDAAAAEALHALGAVGAAEAVTPVMRALARQELAPAAEEALSALALRIGPEVRAAIRARGLEGPEGPYLCRVLGVCGVVDDRTVLEAALRSGHSGLRAAATESLALLLGAPGFPLIADRLADASPEVRAAATRAVAGWPEGRAALRARQSIEEDPLVRAVLAAALARAL
jgi:HEAT repeat protein